MKATKHDGTIGFHDIEHAVRKAMQQGASDAAMNDWICLGVHSKGTDHLVERLKKIRAQILAPISVPSVGFGEISLRLGSEPDRHSFGIKRDRMDDQG